MVSNAVSSDRKSKIVIVLFVAMMSLVFGWQLIMSFYGIDFSDSSYYIANYKLFFDSFSDLSSGTYLTKLFGALLYKLIPSHEYFAFQIFGALSYDLAVFSVWWLFKKRLPKLLLPVCLFVGTLTLSTMPTGVSYNSFSVLLLVPSALFLVSGLMKEKGAKFLILSGALIGFSFFFRIPNVVFAGLFVVIIWYDIFCTGNFKKTWRDLLYFAAGGVAGAALGGIIMKISSGTGVVSGSVSAVVSDATGAGGHSLSNIFRKILNNFSAGFAELASEYLLWLILIAAAAVILLRYTGIKRGAVCAVSVAAAAIVTVIAQKDPLFERKYLSWFNVFCIFLFILDIYFVFYFRRKDTFLSVTSLVSLCFGVAICIGTTNGLCQNSLISYLHIASVVCSIYNYIKMRKRCENRIIKYILPVLSVVMTTVIFAGTAWVFGNRSFVKKYRDFEYYTLDTYTAAPAYYGVKTIEDKAASLDTAYYFFRDGAYSDRKFIVLGDFPAFYVATDSKPYFATTWVDLWTDSKFKNSLNEIEDPEDYPVIVINKSYYNYVKNYKYKDTKKMVAAKEFAGKHGYTRAWSSDYMEIYVPQN
ncbi:MAG: hypothetical protein IKN38_06705 [Clostridia bacterium]|nr:hypothetical protein [Clostridia bacterium]